MCVCVRGTRGGGLSVMGNVRVWESFLMELGWSIRGRIRIFYYYYCCCCCCCCWCVDAIATRRGGGEKEEGKLPACLSLLVDNTFLPARLCRVGSIPQQPTYCLPTYLCMYQAIVDAGMVFLFPRLVAWVVWPDEGGAGRRMVKGEEREKRVLRAFFWS